MTDRKQALTDLLEKVEAGGIEHYEWSVLGVAMPERTWSATKSAYHGSLNAAKALHEAVLPGWEWWRDGETGDMFVGDGSHLDDFWSDLYEEDPARAWLIAILKALIDQEGEE